MSNSAKLSARERIESLVDANSFVEIGGMITKRNTDFNMQEKAVPADGVITGYGVVNSNLVYIYSQDVTALNGSVGEMHAKKIAGIYEMAMKAGAPVIGLIDCAGIRVQEAMDALAGFGDIYMAKVNASGVIPQISAVLGSCGGGVAISSKLGDITIIEKTNGKLFVNSPNAIAGNRIEKCDTSDAAFQAECGNADIVCENEQEVFTTIRSLIDLLPANAGAAVVVENSDDPNRVLDGFDGYATDAKAALTQIADDTKFVELKAEYGPANLTVLSEYSDNFITLISSIQKYAKRLSELGFDNEAIETLEYSVRIGCDMISSYRLLTELYIKNNQPDKINALLEYADALDSITKKPILNFLHSSVV